MKKNMLIICALVLLISSCKKGNDNEQCDVTIATVSGTYKLTALKYKATTSSQEENWYQQVVENCKKDDLYILSANGDFAIQDAGTVCGQNGDYSGAWTLQDNFIDMDGYYFGTVESFDCNTLVFTQTEALIPGDKLTATFVKQ
ncbi:MAG TPA: hypothetical protein VF476_07530 [Chitinophagaceae bacterium]